MGSGRKKYHARVRRNALTVSVEGRLEYFFMIPLRSALIVQEHGVLPYPEGTACAEVLLAGEKEEPKQERFLQDLG